MLIEELKFFSMVKPQPHQLPRLASDEAPHLGVGAHCFNAKKCGYDKDPKDPVHPCFFFLFVVFEALSGVTVQTSVSTSRFKKR